MRACWVRAYKSVNSVGMTPPADGQQQHIRIAIMSDIDL
jgi:hypothetical protein